MKMITLRETTVIRILCAVSFISLTVWATLAETAELPQEPQNHSTAFIDRLLPEQKAWLAQHPEISIGMMNAWPPMNFVDEKGKPAGIGVDYIQAVNQRLGGVIRLVPGPFKDNLTAVKNKSLDALMDVTPKPEREAVLNISSDAPKAFDTSLSLTPAERAWLLKHPVIKLGIAESWAPFVFIKKDGSLEGYDVDFLTRINQLTGANIQLVTGQWKTIVGLAESKKIDGLAQSAVVESRRNSFLFSESYNVVAYAAATIPKKASQVMSSENLKGKRIAHLKGNAWTKKIINHIGNIHVVEANSEEEAFKFVVEDKADFALITLHQFGQLRKIYHQTIAIAHVFSKEEHMLRTVYSIRKDWPQLVSIINKAISAINENERQALFEKWVPAAWGLSGLSLPQIDQFDTVQFLLKSLGAVFGCMLVLILIAWLVKGRPRQLTIRDSLILIFFIYIALISASSGFVILLSQTHTHVDTVNGRNFQALKLAFELKQSSDDLTRFARTYAVTGAPKYERYFRQIAAIRNGKKAHPENFTPFYWDYVAAGNVQPGHQGEVYSIETRMMNLDLSEEEKAKLRQAKAASDDLINLENVAINAVKGLYKDKTGRFTVKKAPDMEMARNILYGKAYHAAKARIMKPIEQFFLLLNWRMASEENQLHKLNKAIILSITALIIITIVFSFYIFLFMRRRMILPLAAIEKGAQAIERGDYTHHIDLATEDEIGHLAMVFNAMVHSIKENTSRLHATIESTTDGILVVDLHQNITNYNQRFLEIWQVAPKVIEEGDDEILLKTVMMKLKEPEAFINRVRQVYGNLEQEDFTSLLLQDGRVVERYSRPQRLGDQIIGRVWSFRDVTQRYKADAELQKLYKAIEASPTSVIIADAIGNIQYVNPKFTELTGYTAPEAIGKNTSMLRSDRHPPEFYEELWSTIQKGNTWHGEICNRKKNGTLYWELASIAPVKTAQGEITHYVAIREDITKRRDMEMALKESKEAAESATRAKSDFLANMSHEVRTPMNAIIGMSHLVLKTDLTPQQRDYISKIDQSAKALLTIINDILDFSKIEAGKLEIESIPFFMDDVLDNIAGLISNKAQEKGLEMIFNTDPDFPQGLVGDPLRLGQVLVNLCSNAVKFTDEGEIVLYIEIESQAPTSVLAKFSVCDTGIGLSSEQQGKLFQSFSQADTSTTREYGGTGLGLAICKSIVRLMDGEIGVLSDPGQGSTFWFTTRFGLHNGKHPGKDHKGLSAGLKGQRILIVDDNENALYILQAMAENFGLDVTIASSGEQALEIIENTNLENPFPLMLIDWKMPGMTGVELARRIKEAPGLKDVSTVIMITVYDKEKLMRQAQGIGIEHFLVKPVNQSILFDTIMEAMGHVIDRHPLPRENDSLVPPNFHEIQGAKILLVEDNEINQEVAAEILTDENFTVTVAENGRQAVDMVTSMTGPGFDVVLMDLQMPVMDGYQATKELRKDHRFDPLPIIAMTADAMSGVREKVLGIGMNDYVTKPIDPAELFKVLAKWVKPPNSISPPKTPPVSAPESTQQAALPDFPGIDVRTGVLRIGGNKDRYLKLLEKFIENQKDAGGRILAAVQNGARDEAVRHAHTLKGISGSIGAVRLYEQAIELETMLKENGDAGLVEKIDEMTRTLDLTCRTLQSGMAREKKQSAETSTEADGRRFVPPPEFARRMEQLSQLLLESSTRARTAMEDIVPMVNGTVLETAVNRIAGLVKAYKFEEARHELKKIVQEFDMDLYPLVPDKNLGPAHKKTS